jgi:uncharacterized protein involved in exopolysaccharide biosynthesis
MDGTNAASANAPRDLGDYVALCWRFKSVIAGVALVAGVGAFAFSLVGPRIYESTVTFAAGLSKIGDGTHATPSTAAFRPMVESLTTAAAVINDVGLDKPPHNLRPSQLLSRVMVVKEIRGTNLITVTVGYNDATMAATIANSVADHAVQTARKVSASEASHARDLVKEQLDQARERLEEADTALRDYRQKTRIEAVRKDVEARLGGAQSPVFPVSVIVTDLTNGRGGLLDLFVKIATEKASLAQTERELKTRVRGDALYASLEAAAATSRSVLATLETQRTVVMGQRDLDARTLSVLNNLYEVETGIGRRQLERTVAEKAYMDLSQRYQEALLQVIGRSAEFVIIDPAVPADRPVSRQVARNTLMAMVIAWLFAIAAVVVWDSAQRRRVLAS